MKVSYMPQRLEFLDCGEKLGWPRIGRLRAGQGNWESLARQAHRRFVPFLRAAKIRVANLNGEKEDALARTVLYGDVLKGLAQEPPPPPVVEAVAEPETPKKLTKEEVGELIRAKAAARAAKEAEEMVVPPRYTSEMRRANLAKAREARRAKRQEGASV